MRFWRKTLPRNVGHCAQRLTHQELCNSQNPLWISGGESLVPGPICGTVNPRKKPITGTICVLQFFFSSVQLCWKGNLGCKCQQELSKSSHGTEFGALMPHRHSSHACFSNKASTQNVFQFQDYSFSITHDLFSSHTPFQESTDLLDLSLMWVAPKPSRTGR